MEEFLEYKYRIILSDRKEILFDIKLNKDTLELVEEEDETPGWTKRGQFGCRNNKCALTDSEICPIARVIMKLISSFKEIQSIEAVEVFLETEERTYSRKCSIQTAVQSITGILMSASGCPILGKLKPLARFHLPFASLEETEFRVFSMYLLAQYLRDKNNLTPDYSLDELKFLYDEIQEINLIAARKIQELEKSDAAINGLVILNSFAQLVTFNVEEKDFSLLETLFKDWLN